MYVKNTLTNIELNQEINSKTIASIGLILSIIAFLILAFCTLRILTLDPSFETTSKMVFRVNNYLKKDYIFFIKIIILLLSSGGLILGLISIIRIQKIGWIAILLSLLSFIICFIN